ncbi:nitrous oxide reductase accessory protein NosL [Neisseria dentiae]|uniref:nitrous oxide reductase accessory protein NosL n=1 Tax=Neisseria dentiae TaxID=194197 RepID=UPI00211BBF6D|nr:nitrous oxide reductase accessory protein NosL [Neisseria dentiae]MCQ9326994.1 nitrous oxide reductase accessory protein NosL [Neisseria dentiae]
MSKTLRTILSAGILSLLLAACGSQTETPRAPQQFTGQTVGHYCGMYLNEHDGPKAQIQLKSKQEPVWFSTVLQMLSYTKLPEEPKDIAAIYVNDMGKVADWSKPNADTAWVDAKQAYYVIRSGFISSMKTQEAIPFARQADAEAFAAKNGGEIVRFDNIPDDYIFQTGAQSSMPQGHRHGSH